ncbi:alpha/beta hydrolase [Listeria weihenstephanensis]|uniref:Alpha/beta hydrolase n=1 Tax=Listeria weihenstephanensis TaxID=1006155 RepID=A0A841Z8Y9_9LIST|nr:alpha/beta hydrolase [Listeria weihenstephanensis]MBC1501670.1 alpha/beta hydrolase [Listeria weihenstephanensis]
MKKITIGFALILLALLAGCGTPKTGEKDMQNLPDLSSQTALILVHGSSGSSDTMDSFSDPLLEDSKTSNERIKLDISTDGELSYHGVFTKSAVNPIVQIGFEDSLDATIEQQTDWLRIAMKDLKTKYNFTKMDGVGHSNGGLVLSTYSEKYAKTAPILERVVAIGSPYNDLDEDDNDGDLAFTDVPVTTPMLKDYEDNRSKISPDLLVLSIAGDIDNGSFSDDIVPVLSAFGSRLIFKDQAKVYLESYFKGAAYDHRTLFANEDVQKKVSWFLYDYSGDKKEVELADDETE